MSDDNTYHELDETIDLMNNVVLPDETTIDSNVVLSEQTDETTGETTGETASETPNKASDSSVVSTDLPKQKPKYRVVFYLNFVRNKEGRPTEEYVNEYFSRYGVVAKVFVPLKSNKCMFVAYESLASTETNPVQITISKIIKEMTDECKFYIHVAHRQNKNYNPSTNNKTQKQPVTGKFVYNKNYTVNNTYIPIQNENSQPFHNQKENTSSRRSGDGSSNRNPKYVRKSYVPHSNYVNPTVPRVSQRVYKNPTNPANSTTQ
jgi:hypothetical protein